MRLGLLRASERAALDKLRPTTLRKANIDDIEVLGHDGLSEDGARLTGDLGSEVPVRQVREHEHPHRGDARELGGLSGRRVARLVRPLLLILRERRLVDEHVRFVGDLEHRPRRPRVPRDHDFSAPTRRAEHLLRPNGAPSGKLDCLAVLKRAEERAFRDAKRSCRIQIEASRPGLLYERVAVGRHAVVHPEDDDPVVAPVECIAGPQLDEPKREGQLAEDPLEGTEEVVQPGRPVDRERELASTESERLQHPGKAKVVIGVVVREKNLGQLDEPDARAQELPLRPLAAVKEQPLSPTPHENRRRPAPRGRHGAGRPEQDEIEIHDRRV
jgi:hypothetical protein